MSFCALNYKKWFNITHFIFLYLNSLWYESIFKINLDKLIDKIVVTSYKKKLTRTEPATGEEDKVGEAVSTHLLLRRHNFPFSAKQS